MSTPPNNPDPRDPNRPRDPGAAADDEPKYGQRIPQPPQPGQPNPYGQPQYGQNQPGQGDQPYTPYGQPGTPNSAGQQPSPYGQQPYGQPPYGQQPQSPYGYQSAQPSGYAYPGPAGQAPGGKGAPPREVMTGFWLILAAGFLTLIYTISSVLSTSDTVSFDMFSAEDREMFAEAGITEDMISSLYVGTGVVMAVLALLVYVLVAVLVRKGKNWARILGTVFAALSAVGVLLSLLTGLAFSSPLELLSVLASLAGIVGIVMLYRPQSQPYFQSRPRFGPY